LHANTFGIQSRYGKSTTTNGWQRHKPLYSGIGGSFQTST